MMAGKEGRRVVRVERPPGIPELELAVRVEAEARRPVVHAPGRQVHGEAPHLARRPEERAAAHRRELLQPPFLRPLVLEPHLQRD